MATFLCCLGRSRCGFSSAAVSQHDITYLELIARFRLQRGNGPGKRRGNLHGGLIRHDFHERLAAFDLVPRLHEPAHQFRLVNAFAKFGKRKFHARPHYNQHTTW